MKIIKLSVNEYKSFEEALRDLPVVLVASYDSLVHKTISDLGFLAIHEVDLYNEGEESDIRNNFQKNKVLQFALRCGVS